MMGADEFVAVLRMRADYIRRKFGRQFVVKVVLALIFGEIFGLVQFPHVVIERRRACVIHVLPEVCGTCFRKLRHYHGMVERAGRLLFELFEQLGVRAGQFAQAEHRQAVEQGFEHG